PHADTTKAGPLPARGRSPDPLASTGFRRLQRYYGPLGLPPGTPPFHRRLIGGAVARRGQGIAPALGSRDGPLLFRIGLSPHAVLSTPRASCVDPVANAVCCLRRDMSGKGNRL